MASVPPAARVLCVVIHGRHGAMMHELAWHLTASSARPALVRSDVFPREAHIMSAAEIAMVDGMLRAVAEDLRLFAGSAA